jgi:predicted lipoprotein with Yx(FWY)xxD motif
MSLRHSRPAMRFAPSAAGVVTAGVLALALAGCGSSSHSSGQSTPPSTARSALQSSGLKTETSPIGTVLAAPSGRTIYELVGATAGHSACTGGCLAIWPEVMSGGHQVVVDGHPAYTFSGDHAPGQANGQGLSDTWGKWWALGPNGVPITTAQPSSTTAPSGNSGYSGY